MPSYIEEITLKRFDGRIIVTYWHGHDYNGSSIKYVIGDDMPKEDLESSYIGALKRFFNESEVWNDE